MTVVLGYTRYHIEEKDGDGEWVTAKLISGFMNLSTAKTYVSRLREEYSVGLKFRIVKVIVTETREVVWQD